jgi:hypothetical protein
MPPTVVDLADIYVKGRLARSEIVRSSARCIGIAVRSFVQKSE